MALLKRKRAGLNDAMSVVTRFVNACNRHDADSVAACLHPDFDSIQPMYPSRNFRGADQVRRNWQAIFDAEPGFRLTVLRSASVDDTVWLELHGAGREAEVAGVFVMGIQGDRIRWARIYSALVEPVLAGEDGPSVTLQGVPPLGDQSNGEGLEESAIAPVLDIDRSGRRRRRRRGSDDVGVEEAPPAAVVPEPEVTAEMDSDGDGLPEPEPEPVEAAEPVEAVEAAEPVGAVEAVEAVEVIDMVEIEPEVVVVVEDDTEVEPVAEAVVDDGVSAVGTANVLAAEPSAPEADDGGPPTEAVEMAALTDPDPPVVGDAPAPEPPKRRFGKRPRS